MGSRILNVAGLPTLPSVLVVLGIFIAANLSVHFYLKESRNGGYSKWSGWGNCSRECGEGIRTRTRSCDNPPPGYFGSDCSQLGSSIKQSDCFVAICPINGAFGPWGEFGKCDKTCGGGVQVKTRPCDNPPAAFGGKACEGQSVQSRSCNTQTCPPPVDGGFSDWSPFSPCSVSCGVGKRTRARFCSNPPPQNGGKLCVGNFQEESECRMQPCIDPSLTTQITTHSANVTEP